MSYCPKCGKTHENNKFKCTACGAPLVYGPSDESPGFFEKIMRYKSFVILIALAIVVSMVSIASQILNIVFWVILVGIVGVTAFYYLKQKNRNQPKRRDYSSYTGKNTAKTPKSNTPIGGNQRRASTERKTSNVISLEKRRNKKNSADKENSN